jgi:hypothetical protein
MRLRTRSQRRRSKLDAELTSRPKVGRLLGASWLRPPSPAALEGRGRARLHALSPPRCAGAAAA